MKKKEETKTTDLPEKKSKPIKCEVACNPEAYGIYSEICKDCNAFFEY